MKAPSFGLILVAAFALGTGLNGLYTGVRDIPSAPNGLAVAVAVINLTLGVTGLAAAVLIWGHHRWATWLIVLWGASAVAAAVLAPRAYAPEAGWPAALIGGLVTAALVVTIVLYVRWRVRITAAGESSPAS